MSEQTVSHSYNYCELSTEAREQVETIIESLKHLSVAEIKKILAAVRSELDVRSFLNRQPDYQGR